MTTSTLECPKCGRIVPQATECARCGVVFAKIRAAGESETPRTRASPPESLSEPREPQRRMMPLLGLLVIAGLAAVAALQWVEGRAAEIEASAVEPMARLRPRTEPQPGPERPADPSPEASLGAAQARPATRRLAPTRPEPVAVASKPRWVDPDSTWFQGATGFERGLERASAKNQAVLVYFYADWCGYCRQLESELLYRAVVEEYTKYLVKIRVNPEKGRRARALANHYGVTGYPSVFVHPAGLGAPQKVRAMTRESGEWRVLSPQAYVERLIATAGERFGAS